ncbi:MAG TPA: hypothetical protein VGK59_17000 [Ohtaekwangia sp.]
MAETIEVNFYSQKISIAYDKSVAVDHSFSANDQSIRLYYNQLLQSGYTIIVSDLQRAKKELHLNDWFYYELVRNTAATLFKNESENYRQAFTWFILGESGYNVIIGFTKSFELYVYSQSEVYDRSIITLGDKDYVSIDNFPKTGSTMGYCQFIPGTMNAAFDFSITLPNLKGDSILEMQKEFTFKGSVEKYTYSVSSNFLEFMRGYPKLNSQEYFSVQLSPVTYNSLMPQLKERIKGLSEEDAVRYLLSFVRLTFSPQFDSENKPVDFNPMIAEETLYYAYGDCEGKSVLFHFLVKELVGTPMIALLYPNHINVAVQFNQSYGSPVKFNDGLYTVCEPNLVGDIAEFDHAGSTEKYARARVMVIN